MGAAERTGVQPPSLGGVVDSLYDRVRDLSGNNFGGSGTGDPATITGSGSGRSEFHQTFHFVGSLFASVSDPWPVPRTGRLWVVRFQPSTAGSTDTTVKVYKNGSALTPVGAASTTITLTASSSAEKTVTFDDLYVRNPDSTPDSMKVEIVGAGTGASGLLVTACWM